MCVALRNTRPGPEVEGPGLESELSDDAFPVPVFFCSHISGILAIGYSLVGLTIKFYRNEYKKVKNSNYVL